MRLCRSRPRIRKAAAAQRPHHCRSGLNHPGQAPTYKINETDVTEVGSAAALTEIYSNRAERIMFVRGDDDVNFAAIAEVIDIGNAANVDHIGLMTPKIMAGQ